MRVYDGANWIAASSAGGASLILYEYTATSGQTTFSGSDDNAATLSYTADNIQVVMNGVILDPSDFTATDGTSVVLASGAAANDLVNIYAFKSFTVADTVSASAGGTFSANVAITGDLTVDTNTLHVDAANNRVGIGSASPAVNLDIVEDTAATDAIIGITAGTGGRAQIRSEAQPDGTSSVLSFHTMSGSNTSEVGRFLAGGGLTFNGDTAAANALDDYEEGTWTPTDNSGAGLTFTSANGYYTKIGDVVVAAFKVVYPTTAATNATAFSGLPFSGANLADSMYGGLLTYHSESVHTYTLLVGDANSNFTLFYNGNAQRGVNNFSGKQVRGILTYKAA
jgi:hypothetical protein